MWNDNNQQSHEISRCENCSQRVIVIAIIVYEKNENAAFTHLISSPNWRCQSKGKHFPVKGSLERSVMCQSCDLYSSDAWWRASFYIFIFLFSHFFISTVTHYLSSHHRSNDSRKWVVEPTIFSLPISLSYQSTQYEFFDTFV